MPIERRMEQNDGQSQPETVTLEVNWEDPDKNFEYNPEGKSNSDHREAAEKFRGDVSHTERLIESRKKELAQFEGYKEAGTLQDESWITNKQAEIAQLEGDLEISQRNVGIAEKAIEDTASPAQEVVIPVDWEKEGNQE